MVRELRVMDRLNVIATLPYVQTKRTRACSANARAAGFHPGGEIPALFRVIADRLVSTFAAGSAGLPMTDYTPDFYPLSIGSNSKRVSARFTMNVHTKPGWFVTGRRHTRGAATSPSIGPITSPTGSCS